MSEAGAKSDSGEPRRLPRGRHALAPEQVRADQRRRLVEAVPRVVSKRGYEAMSVADIVRAAAVSRNAFYENFADKEACFAAAHEACHGRLLDALEQSCDRRASVEERFEAALGRAFALLATEPDVARLLFVGAPAPSDAVARRYYEWLRRYGALLSASEGEGSARSGLSAEMTQLIVGGLATRVASEALDGRATELRALVPHALDYLLAFSAASPAADRPSEQVAAGRLPAGPPDSAASGSAAASGAARASSGARRRARS